VSPVTAKWVAGDVVVRTWKAAREKPPGSSSVNDVSLVIGFSRVAEMALFQDWDPVVLEGAPEGNDT